MENTEWISVKEFLPGNSRDVIVLRSGGVQEIMSYIPPKENYCWGWYPGGCSIENSTHWRETPDLPLGVKSYKYDYPRTMVKAKGTND